MSFREHLQEGPKDLRRRPVKTGLSALTVMFALAGTGLIVEGCINPQETQSETKQTFSMTVGEIKDMQESLKKLHYYHGKIDGIYGPQSRAAVIGYQKANALKDDGKYGEVTRMFVGQDLAGKKENLNMSEKFNRWVPQNVLNGSVVALAVWAASCAHSQKGLNPHAENAFVAGSVSAETSRSSKKSARKDAVPIPKARPSTPEEDACRDAGCF